MHEALARRGSPDSGRTRPQPGRRPRQAVTRSSRPGRHPESRLRSRFRSSRRSPRTRTRGRCSSTRRRRLRRTRRARSRLTACRVSASRSTTATRQPTAGATCGRGANVDPHQPRHAPRRVLPHHDRWGDVLHNLRYVVVDEAHVYRGVFGSHVGNVLRRLRRLALAYGAAPAVPARLRDDPEPGRAGARPDRPRGAGHRRRLCPAARPRDRAVESRDHRRRARDAGERPRRRVAPHGRARRRRPADHLLRKEPQGRRVDPPLRLRSARPARPRARLAPYRAGYTPEQRREIERRLADGELLGVSTTDALELGIDIGELDCAISVGFPGTVASLRQQWGRAGRRRTAGSLSSSQARTGSTSSSCASRRRFSAGAWRRRSSITPARGSWTLTCSPLPSKALSRPPTQTTLGPEALERAPLLAELAATPAGYVWKGP